MTKILIKKLIFPLCLFIFCLLAYGILIPKLGFYWDDWPMIWFAHSQGPWGFPAAFSGDRPFLSGIYIITTSILGIAPIQWQILGLISRWLVALSAWWTIGKIWPQHKEEASWAAILIAIFPGFKQQPISVVYSNGLFLLVSYYLSYGLMASSIKVTQKRLLLTISALITYAICLLSTEYYIGLDMVRGAVIWLLLSDIKGIYPRLKKTFQVWLPYLGVLGSFLIWRVFIFKFPTYQPELVDTVSTKTQQAIFNLIFRIIQDPIKAGWDAWTSIIHLPTLSDFSTNATTFYWVIFLASFIFTIIFLFFINPRLFDKTSTNTQNNKPNSFLIIGVIALFFSGWPYWITNLPVGLQYPYDRFMLAFMLGSALFIVGLLAWLIKFRYQRIIILAILIAASIGNHFLNTNSYRRDWITHNDFFWQLVWRAPSLKPGTTLITYSLPTTYYSDNSLTAPLNLIYDFDNHSLDLSYLFAFAGVRVGRSIPKLEPGYPIEQSFRNAEFRGNTSNAVVLFYSSPGCLRILDPERDLNLPIYPIEYNQAIPISNLSQIETDTKEEKAYMPVEIFGKEPPYTWCYYFQKADLAYQVKDWQTIRSLREEAESLGYMPSEPSENLLFIEAYAHSGDWEKVSQLALQSFYANPLLQNKICSTIEPYQSTGLDNSNQEQIVLDLLEDLDCETN